MLFLRKRRLFRRQRVSWGVFSAVLIIVIGGGALASSALAKPLADPLEADPLENGAFEDAAGDSGEMKAFHQLSSGNQNIAWALFDSQNPEPDGKAAGGLMEPGWDLEDIVAARESGMNWDQVFKQMKSEGLVAGENLEQMTQSYFAEGAGKPNEKFLAARKANSEIAAASRARAEKGSFKTGLQSQIVITNAAGGRVVVGLPRRIPARSAVIAPAREDQTQVGAASVLPAGDGRPADGDSNHNTGLVF